MRPSEARPPWPGPGALPRRTDTHPCERNLHARVRSAQGLGFGRRGGSGSVGAGPRHGSGPEPHGGAPGWTKPARSGPLGAEDWLRLARGIGFVWRRGLGPGGASTGRPREARGPASRPLPARRCTGVDERRTLGFDRPGCQVRSARTIGGPHPVAGLKPRTAPRAVGHELVGRGDGPGRGGTAGTDRAVSAGLPREARGGLLCFRHPSSSRTARHRGVREE